MGRGASEEKRLFDHYFEKRLTFLKKEWLGPRRKPARCACRFLISDRFEPEVIRRQRMASWPTRNGRNFFRFFCGRGGPAAVDPIRTEPPGAPRAAHVWTPGIGQAGITFGDGPRCQPNEITGPSSPFLKLFLSSSTGRCVDVCQCCGVFLRDLTGKIVFPGRAIDHRNHPMARAWACRASHRKIDVEQFSQTWRPYHIGMTGWQPLKKKSRGVAGFEIGHYHIDDMAHQGVGSSPGLTENRASPIRGQQKD